MSEIEKRDTVETNFADNEPTEKEKQPNWIERNWRSIRTVGAAIGGLVGAFIGGYVVGKSRTYYEIDDKNPEE